jgi:hypothetical protein
MPSTYRIRASSLWELCDCALRWQKKNLQHLWIPSTPPAAIGTAVHASTAAFDQSNIDGTGLTVDVCAGIAVDSIQTPQEEVSWGSDRPEKAIETAIKVHTSYCLEIAPTQVYMMVEMTMKPLRIDMGDGIIFELTGTLDRIREKDGLFGVADVKTGFRAVAADGSVVIDKHLPQLGEYELLAEAQYGPMELAPVIIGLHTGGTGRVGIGEIKGAKEALVGDEHGLMPGILQYVAQYFRSGLFPPNPGSFLCSSKYCPFHKQCPYHG